MTLQFSTPLHKGTLLNRYKRFLADVRLENGEVVTAHCPNTGSMKTCFEVGSPVWLSPSNDPKRKLKWTWEFSETTHGLIGVNTSLPNGVIAESIALGKIKELAGYKSLRKEVKYGTNSRIDILLEDPSLEPCYVEVKNTTLLYDDCVLFPDAVSERGRKHLEELSKVASSGGRAVMVFLVNRPEGRYFSPADLIDPEYGKALRSAAKVGVEVLALRAISTTNEITTGETLPVRL